MTHRAVWKIVDRNTQTFDMYGAHRQGNEDDGDQVHAKAIIRTLNWETMEQAQRVFSALADGGQITMPLQPTFWAKTWGMLIDTFGTPWTVNYERVLCSQEQKS
jgi:uncharacterized glyoxalase superfamily protein PhnB